MVYYSIIHPQNYGPFSDIVMNNLHPVTWMYGGLIDAIKQQWCCKDPRPLPEGYSQYDHMIKRMMHKDKKQRATITEVVQILADIKAKQH